VESLKVFFLDSTHNFMTLFQFDVIVIFSRSEVIELSS
jgi:hypothetical protein